MPFFSFAAGLTLRRGEQLLEFRRKLDDGHIQFEDPLTGQLYRWDMDKIYREINAGALHVFRGDSHTNEITPTTGNSKDYNAPLLPSLDSLPEKYRSDLERKKKNNKTRKRQSNTQGQRNQNKVVIPK